MIDAIIHLCSSITSIEKIIFLLESLFIFWIIVSKRSMNIISSTLSLKNHMYCHVWFLNVNVKNFKFNLHHFNSTQIWLRSCLDLTQSSCLNLTQMWLRCILVLLVHHHVKMRFISLCIIILNCISSFSYSDLTQILSKSDSDISFKSDSDVIQMYFHFLCIITLNCISSFFYSDLTQILSRFDSDISFKSDSKVIQMCFHFSCIITLKCVSSRLVSSRSDLIQMWLRSISISSVLHHIKMRSHQLLSCFSLYLQFFLILSCFSSLFCKSSVLKREATVMMSDYQLNLEHKLLIS